MEVQDRSGRPWNQAAAQAGTGGTLGVLAAADLLARSRSVPVRGYNSGRTAQKAAAAEVGCDAIVADAAAAATAGGASAADCGNWLPVEAREGLRRH